MRIADLPERERPRERLTALGTAALADRELLAVLLGTGGSPGTGALALAERVLARFGSVTAVARAHPADLAAVSGVGSAKAAALAAAFELARRATRVEDPVVVTHPGQLVPVAAPLLRGRARERLVVISGDRSGRVLGTDVLCEGSADTTLVPAREVLVAVLRRDGASFGLAHNHPGGDPSPSDADIEATAHVRRVSTGTGLRFLGHVVITDHDWREVPQAPEYADAAEARMTVRHRQWRRQSRLGHGGRPGSLR